MSKQLKSVYFLLAGFIVFNIVWHVLAILLDVKALPTPIAVYSSYQKALKNGIIFHAYASFFRIGVTLVTSAVIATVAGVAMGYSNTVNKALSPLLYLSFPIPKLALMPIIMIFFGIGDLSKIMIMVLIIVFQLIVSVRDAVMAIPAENYDVFVSLRANTWAKIRHITIPATIPAILSALRVSAGIAISVLIVAEGYGTNRGMGFYLIDSWMRADYVQMYFGILLLSLMGFTIFLMLDLLEKYCCRWKK